MRLVSTLLAVLAMAVGLWGGFAAAIALLAMVANANADAIDPAFIAWGAGLTLAATAALLLFSLRLLRMGRRRAAAAAGLAPIPLGLALLWVAGGLDA
ncbi:MAG: hypothetical protein ACK4WC_01760 [Rubrimonas sp.]